MFLRLKFSGYFLFSGSWVYNVFRTLQKVHRQSGEYIRMLRIQQKYLLKKQEIYFQANSFYTNIAKICLLICLKTELIPFMAAIFSKYQSYGISRIHLRTTGFPLVHVMLLAAVGGHQPEKLDA